MTERVPPPPAASGGAAKGKARIKERLGEADQLGKAGDVSAALAILEDLVAGSDGAAPPIVFLKLSKLHRQQGDFGAAEAANARGRAVHPAHIGLAIAAAQLAVGQENWSEAARRWAEAVELGANEPAAPAYLGLARASRRAGDIDAAVAAVEAGIALFPEDPALAQEESAISRLRDRRDAKAALADPHLPIPIETVLEMAEEVAERDQWTEVATLLRPVIERHGDEAPTAVFRLLAGARRRLGESALAEETIQHGIAARPDEPSLAVEYARIAMSEQDWADAVARWGSLIERFGGRLPPPAWVDASVSATKAGDNGLAESVSFRGCELYPEDQSLAVEHARVAMLRFDWPTAATRWRAVIERHGMELARQSDQLVARAAASLIEGGECELAIELMGRVRSQRGDRQLFLAAEGIALLRLGRFDEARRHWSAFWQLAERGSEHFGHHQRLRYLRPLDGNAVFEEASPKRLTDNGTVPARMCVYTALFGGYDRLVLPTYSSPGIDFICFSDRPLDCDGWQVRIVDADSGGPALASRDFKIRPHRHLTEYAASIYVDANVLLVGDLGLFVRRWLAGRSFVAWPHPERSDAYNEIEAILAHLRHPPLTMVALYERLRGEGMPSGQGLVEATFLWRDHRDADVAALMDAWWDEVRKTNGRDQPPLAYLMWKTGLRPQTLPERLGTCGFNDFYVKLPHLATPLEMERRGGAFVASPAGPKHPGGSSRRLVGASRTLAFVYRDGDVQTATMMRGQQLVALASQSVSEPWRVAYVEAEQAAAIGDAVMVLTRSFLRHAGPDELAAMKARGNTICVDNVDHPARGKLHQHVDVYVAASITQYAHYLKTIDDRAIHLITHHADPAIGSPVLPGDGARIGYFGELVNARHMEALEGDVDFFQTNNVTVRDRTWIDRLADYNVHYAVRRERPGDVFKPFTKGFTAARTGANIIVPLDEGDVRYYLGADYPYVLADDSLEAVREMVAKVREGFGGPEWDEGIEVMRSVRARSSPEHIAGEINALLARLA